MTIARVGLVSVGRADDVRVWSGIPFNVKTALRGCGVEVADISPLRVPFPRARHTAFLAAGRLGRTYRYELDTATIAAFGRQVTERVRAAGVDAVISTSALAVAEAQIDVPVALWGDATIANLRRTYMDYARLPRWQARNGRRAERDALARASVAAYASPWAAESAIASGADPSRIMVLPFGANLEPGPSFDAALVVRARRADGLRLLWVGADWLRKRGAFCVEVATLLVDRGFDVRLAMIGASGPAPLPPAVDHLGFLNQQVAADRQRMAAEFERAHVLLLPSLAECFGIVVAEANAHAVPCVASDVGGIPGAVEDGQTGRLMAPDATVGAYASAVADLVADRAAYEETAFRARARYLERLNWRVSTARLLQALTIDG